MGINTNPPPRNVPQSGDVKTRDFLKRLSDSLYHIFYASGGKDGTPKNFKNTGTPSDTATPAGYVKINLDGNDVYLPYYE